MKQATRTTRHLRTKFPPEYSRTLAIDDMPHGGVRSTSASVPQISAWQLPTPWRFGDVLTSGGLKRRLCMPAPRFSH